MATHPPVNPYQPPASGGDVVPAAGADGSLEKALAGDYDFEISDVLKEAWELNNGFKGTFWGGALVAYLLVFVVFMVLGFILALVVGSDAGMVLSVLMNVAITGAVAPLL